MEAILNNEQVRPGDETQFMHAIFTSDEEMMTFYLTLNRFVNMGTYFVQRPDIERLENLLVTLGKFHYFVNLLGSYHTLGMKQLIEGFGMYIAQQYLSSKSRRCTSENIGYQVEFLLNLMKESGRA
ncbi:hypothetical protein [Bacteroides sp.]|uniref:hypothetical protein n=1 Tax=Bacteroides sp. TaxID=29523 RepID=UPI00260FD932|nr:hypothetical protein [Bacteroides sp.]